MMESLRRNSNLGRRTHRVWDIPDKQRYANCIVILSNEKELWIEIVLLTTTEHLQV